MKYIILLVAMSFSMAAAAFLSPPPVGGCTHKQKMWCHKNVCKAKGQLVDTCASPGSTGGQDPACRCKAKQKPGKTDL